MTKFLNISTDNTLGGNSPSDETVSSQKSIKEYVDNNTAPAGSYVTTNTAQTITEAKTFTKAVHFTGTGDTNAVFLTENTRFDIEGTTRTILGMGNAQFNINHSAYALLLRGKNARPSYNSATSYLALLSDVPTVNNPTITFTQGGTTKGTITLNQSGDQTIEFDAGSGGGAVDSVNGQTGTVVLDAEDVGALPDSTVIPTDTSDLTNGAGFITSSALSGYATQTWVGQQGYLTSTALNGYATEQWVGQQGYITGITSSDVTTALGYTPYDASNPNGYTSNVGTVTSVNNVQPVNGNVSLSIPSEVTESTVSGWGFTKNTGTVTSVNNVGPVDGNVTISIPTVDQSYDGTSTNAQSGVAVKSAIDSAISSVYKPAGSVAFASLPALSSSIEGYVYNVTDSFTTTSDFVEGAGKTYPAGTNVVCIDVGSSVYKWDVLSGMVDLSGYVPTSRTINNKALTSNISLTASDVGALPDSTVIPTVNNATLTIQKNGTNVATFTANSSSNSTANITVPTQASDVGAVEANASITGATKCKITYDSKGLVTGGADLQASDIPSLTLSKISDITATASEVNVLDGITASTTELNYLDGVTSSIQTQLNGKVPNTRTVNGKALSSDVDLTYSDVDALSDSTKFGADLSYSGNQLQLLDQDGNALGNAQTIKSSPDLDGKSITKNSSDELQTVGVIDQNDTTTALKQWSGTKAQYDAIVSKDANTVYNITDDTNPTQALLEAIYPVGSIYIGTMNVCPMSALFGTWTKVAEDRVLQGAGTRGSVGTTVNESLPNITGRLDFICVGNTQNNLGAFSQSVRESDVNKNTILNGGENMINLGIDASRSSSTYQDSAPVQQDAYLVNIWQRTQ